MKDLLLKLRNQTQAGMADCARALKESNNNYDKAVDLIKVWGKNIVSSNATKEAFEGLIVTKEEHGVHVMVECNCQTDFVAKSDIFKTFANVVAATLAHESSNHASIAQEVEEVSAATKENCLVRRFVRRTPSDPTERTVMYNHHGSLGVILSAYVTTSTGEAVSKEVGEKADLLLHDLALQVAAMAPIAVSPESLSGEALDRQKSIFQTQIDELKKPLAAQPKIMEGKLNKWFGEVCLLNQESIHEQGTSVAKRIEALEKTHGFKIILKSFDRFKVGEGSDKADMS